MPEHRTIPTREYAARDLGRLADVIDSTLKWLDAPHDHVLNQRTLDATRDAVKALRKARRELGTLLDDYRNPALLDWPDE